MDEHQVVALEMAVRLRPVPPAGGVAQLDSAPRS